MRVAFLWLEVLWHLRCYKSWKKNSKWRSNMPD